jgi:hypothetical protein
MRSRLLNLDLTNASIIAAIVLLSALPLYVLSYPLAVRAMPDSELRCYAPVEWLLDETPFSEPIFCCALLLGAEDAVAEREFIRAIACPELSSCFGEWDPAE